MSQIGTWVFSFSRAVFSPFVRVMWFSDSFKQAAPCSSWQRRTRSFGWVKFTYFPWAECSSWAAYLLSRPVIYFFIWGKRPGSMRWNYSTRRLRCCGWWYFGNCLISAQLQCSYSIFITLSTWAWVISITSTNFMKIPICYFHCSHCLSYWGIFWSFWRWLFQCFSSSRYWLDSPACYWRLKVFLEPSPFISHRPTWSVSKLCSWPGSPCRWLACLSFSGR